MPNSPAPCVARTPRSYSSALLALGVVATLGLVLAARWDVRPVYASTQGNDGSADSDDDGLPDILERSLGTSPTTDDSDGDGFSDLEELARQSEPRSQSSLPEDVDYSVGITAYGEGGLVHLVIAAYAHDGRFGNKVFRVGGVGRGQSFVYPFTRLVGLAQTDAVPAHLGGEILVLDIPVRHTQILGNYTAWYVLMGRTGTHGFASAASVDLMRSGDIVLRGPSQAFNQPTGPSGMASAQAASSSQAVYQPISNASGGDPGAGGEAGRICSRTSATTGSQGGVLNQEVTSSGCDDGWDSHCDSGCADSAGQVYRTVDPMAMVGG